MKRLKLQNAAFLLGIVLLFTFVLSAAAGFDAFTLTAGPTYIDPNYVWTGTAAVSSPQDEVCIGFSGADPAIDDVLCSWNSGTGAFSCVVPLSDFDGNLGNNLTWQIFASNQTACGGNTAIPDSEDANGSITPTAVTLSSFGAGELPDLTWLFAPAALALLTGIVFVRRRQAP